jgi:hypothetical protein
VSLATEEYRRALSRQGAGLVEAPGETESGGLRREKPSIGERRFLGQAFGGSNPALGDRDCLLAAARNGQGHGP